MTYVVFPNYIIYSENAATKPKTTHILVRLWPILAAILDFPRCYVIDIPGYYSPLSVHGIDDIYQFKSKNDLMICMNYVRETILHILAILPILTGGDMAMGRVVWLDAYFLTLGQMGKTHSSQSEVKNK